jgi:predicted nucleotide-binding protein
MAKAKPTNTPHQPIISADLALRKLRRLLDQVEEVRSSGRDSATLQTWKGNVRIVLSEFYGETSIPYREFAGIRFSPFFTSDRTPESDYQETFNSGLGQAKGFLESRVNDLRESTDQPTAPTLSSVVPNPDSRKVFVVHGHGHGHKETVARFLGALDLEPIILHEQADEGRTIIEKFEAHATNVQCAVVILTADDIAASKANPEVKELRARQNVILEFGFFAGKLGRARTFALVEKDVALPSDMHGLIYIPLDTEEWRLRLVKELKAIGLQVDANLAF